MKAYRGGLWSAVTAAGVLLSVPPLRTVIEQSMFWHMLIQMPLLVLGGWLFLDAARDIGASKLARKINVFGLTGFMLALLVIAYWMIPSSIDRAVVLPTADASKLASLWLVGLALRDSFARSTTLIQLFFLGYALPMTVWLGTYFATTELRLCNAYSLETQRTSGIGLVVLAVGLGLIWLDSLARSSDAQAERPVDAAV